MSLTWCLIDYVTVEHQPSALSAPCWALPAKNGRDATGVRGCGWRGAFAAQWLCKVHANLSEESGDSLHGTVRLEGRHR